jgi:hypothetical protein
MIVETLSDHYSIKELFEVALTFTRVCSTCSRHCNALRKSYFFRKLINSKHTKYTMSEKKFPLYRIFFPCTFIQVTSFTQGESVPTRNILVYETESFLLKLDISLPNTDNGTMCDVDMSEDRIVWSRTILVGIE